MGYVQETLAEVDQTGEGIIVALEDDNRIRRALSITPSIQFDRYEIQLQAPGDIRQDAAVLQRLQ